MPSSDATGDSVDEVSGPLTESPFPAEIEPELTPLERMEMATSAAEIAKLQREFPEPECRAAWRALSPLQRSTLLLARMFPGSTILHPQPGDDFFGELPDWPAQG